MAGISPLQLLLFRDPEDQEFIPFENAVLRAFQGGREAGSYLATGDDLGIQLECFTSVPGTGLSGSQTLDSFCHTLIVIWADEHLADRCSSTFSDWLAECWNVIQASEGRHSIIIVARDERIAEEWTRKNPNFANLQLLYLHELGERAIRPATFALRLLHESRLLLSSGVPPIGDPAKPQGFLRLFISHAKMDGLPLAHALKHQIASLAWLQSFYDAEDLPSGSNWKRELERGVGSSLIIVLRTEAYDSRYWCQQEVLWADEYAVPAVLVEGRTGLQHSAGTLPLDRLPTVRIPDGNLVRILFLALREGLRFLYFLRRVEEMRRAGDLPTPSELRIFSFPPSMPALLRACRYLSSVPDQSIPRIILYPDPPLRTGLYEAASALVGSYCPGARLLTPNTLAATSTTS
jgi:hypothetical protein